MTNIDRKQGIDLKSTHYSPFNYSPVSGSLRCEEGYSLLSGAQYVLLGCRAGVWQAVPDTPKNMVVNEQMAAPSSCKYEKSTGLL